MIIADTTEKKCFIACSEEVRKQGRCSCLTNLNQFLKLRRLRLEKDELCDLAKEFYFRDVKVKKWQDDFILALEKRTVVDKRADGYHCTYCCKMSKNAIAYVATDRVIFPQGFDDELWIVDSHYDGCRGWD